MYCRKCGTENSESAKFCRKCGTPLGQGMENREQDTHAGSPRSHKVPWIVLTILLLAAAILGAVYLGVRQKEARQNREYEGYLSDAAKYLEDADYERAEESYLEAIAIEPKRAEPYIDLADLYSGQDAYDKAEGYYHKAIELKPDDVRSYLGLSEVYLKQGDYEKAEGILKNAKKAVKDETGKSEIQKQQDKVLDAQANFSWVLEPTIEADNIYYVTENDMPQYTLNEMERQHMSPYAVIQRGEMLGMIDMTGGFAAGMDYIDIKMVENKCQMTRKDPKYFEAFRQDWYTYYLLDDGSTGELFELESGYSNGFLYYCGGLQQGLPGMELPVPEGSFPIKQSDVPYQGDFSGAYEWWRTLSGNYAICNGNELVTDFIYEECGSCSDGLMAACQNGKWGYVNENGETVIPFEYDASWPEYERTDLNYENETNKEYCYAASDGYVVLCKGNEWQLQDVSGDVVIPSGIFEAIRPVYEGKCWVKKNGKWGVIQLAEDGVAEPMPTTTPTAVPTSTPKSTRIELDSYIDSYKDMRSLVGGEPSQSVGDHENWIVGDGIQYGNYLGSDSVDEFTIDSDKYSVYGVGAGMNQDEVSDTLLGNGWTLQESGSDWRSYKNSDLNLSIHLDSSGKCMSVTVYRDVEW